MEIVNRCHTCACYTDMYSPYESSGNPDLSGLCCFHRHPVHGWSRPCIRVRDEIGRMENSLRYAPCPEWVSLEDVESRCS